MDHHKTIILKPGKEQSLLRFHPWIFSGAVKKLPEGMNEGDLVRVVSHDGVYLGVGHYQPGTITVRILSFAEEEIDASFWSGKIGEALRVRIAAGICGNPAHNVFRLVHGEGDGLPGLIVDYYNGLAVIQAHTTGMFLARNLIAKALASVLGEQLKAVYDKSEKTMPFKSPVKPSDGFIAGSLSSPHLVSEFGLQFQIEWETGQKTGFFIDQRENRKLVEGYARKRKVLNMFCYTGGFSVYALQGGARLVHSVDSSARAMDLCVRNAELNFPGDPRHGAFTADAFEFLNHPPENYDLIILDPPAFAKHQDVLPQALKAYKRLNAKALQIIEPGGILFTFSCSQIVPREKFREAVFSAAAISKRKVRILYQLNQPADHPVNIYHPEGEYLKGLVLYVE